MLTHYHNQLIIIFGLGGEGLSTYRFLRDRLPTNRFILIDEKPLTKLNPVWQKLVKTDARTQFATNISPLSSTDLAHSILFKTPGIPLSHPLVHQVATAGAEITSNTQLFFELVATSTAPTQPELNQQPKLAPQTKPSHQPGNGHQPQNSPRPKLDPRLELDPRPKLITIGVTGTKGKSTTATMIYHLLHENNLDAYLGGNIGQPALEMWLQWQNNPAKSTTQTIFVLELSCHQLATLTHSPQIAVIQNIVSEHLDYYADFEQYYQAKTQIARFQTPDDIIIFNHDSPTATQLAQLSPAKKISFSVKKNHHNHNHSRNHQSHQKKDSSNQLLQLAQHSPLRGQHNLYNVMPALIIGQLFGLNKPQMLSAVQSFQSLPHRLELVAKIRGVEYYDDSIATNPEATIAALNSFPPKQVVLIAGGYERHQNYQQLAREILTRQVRAVALLPTTGHRLSTEIKRLQPEYSWHTSIKEVTNLVAAVSYAHQQAQAEDAVLLSPAAASFNDFKNYKDRGNQFKKAVQQLAQQP